jgi:hypothetical protein
MPRDVLELWPFIHLSSHFAIRDIEAKLVLWGWTSTFFDPPIKI